MVVSSLQCNSFIKMSIKHHKTEYINAITHRMLVLKTINEAITI